MCDKPVCISVLSDFNVQNFEALLEKSVRGYSLRCMSAPFGQTSALLLDPQNDFWASYKDALVLWTMPERALPSFGSVIAFKDYSLEPLLTEVDLFAELLSRIPPSVGKTTVPTWVGPA